MGLHELANRIGTVERLDAAAKPAAAAIKRALGRGTAKDVLSGKPLGHPLHPLLTDLPIGAFSGAALLDAFEALGGRSDRAPAADTLVAAGLLTAVPAALAGASDWSETYGEDARTGLVHALANVGALTLYAGSLIARKTGNRRTGRLLAFGGLGVLGVAGYLGGHLSYGRGIGVNNTFFQHGPSDWVRTVALVELDDGKPRAVEAGDATVLLVRSDGDVRAIADRCTHAGGPLHEGSVDLAACTVTCPWHGSEFRLDDGRVVHGPASVPQPAYDARVVDGHVEVRRRPARG